MLDNITPYNVTFEWNNNNLTYVDSRTPTKSNAILRNMTNLQFIPSNSMTLYNVTLSGTRDGVDFNRTISVLRRNL
jgi:hypothetical protein